MGSREQIAVVGVDAIPERNLVALERARQDLLGGVDHVIAEAASVREPAVLSPR